MSTVFLGLVTVIALGAVVLTALTHDPTDPLAVLIVIGGAAVAIGAATAIGALRLEERRSAALGRRRILRAQRLRALRRGAEVGAVVAAFASLRAVDGLTLITGGFVVSGFALAEIVLAIRPVRSAR